MKFREKATSKNVRAIQWKGDEQSKAAIAEFMHHSINAIEVDGSRAEGNERLVVPYDGPIMSAFPFPPYRLAEGDWIVRNEHGEPSILNPDAFRENYEPANKSPM